MNVHTPRFTLRAGTLGAFARTHVLLAVLVGLTATGYLLYVSHSRNTASQEKVLVSSGSVVDYVRITGQVEPSTEASLAFQMGGAVSYVGVGIGDAVEKGKVLATVQSGDIQAQLLQAEANLASQRALYDQLSGGARPEEVAIKEQVYKNAEASLSQTYSQLPDSIRQIDGVMGDVLKSKLAPLFTNLGSQYILSFSSCDQRLAAQVEKKRTEVELTLEAFQKDALMVTAIASNETVEQAFLEGYDASVEVNSLVNTLSSLLLAQCSTSNASLEAYRLSLSAVKTQLSTLFTSISANRSALIVAKNAVASSKRDIELVKAGTDPNKLRSQAALVKQAEAQVFQYQAALEKTKIISPFAGTISDVALVVGETATQGKSAISMLATDVYQIEAKIPEMDIVKLRLGGKVRITLDAYGKGVEFPATITRINPTATQDGNVPVYKVLVSFTQKDDRIKAGMTANLRIEAAYKQGVVVVPLRFVTLINETMATVLVAQGGIVIEKNVELGVRGDDGSVEVVSGLRVGDTIISPATNLRSAQKQSGQ
jgi:HlyD family secretion protein